MGLWGKAAKALVIIVITQIACRHCMPRTPRKTALLNNFNPAKNNPLSTPFSSARTDKTSKQTSGKTSQNARINKNSFPKESIFKKHNFPENDFPLDTTARDPFNLKTNFNNYQANRAKANSLRNTQSSIINELKKERKMKRKLQSNAQINNDIDQPTKETLPTTFPSGSVNTLLNPQTFPDIQYPLNTMDTWEPMYWNSFSLVPPTPFDGLETPRQKTTINENAKNTLTRLTKTKAKQFLKSYDKLKQENKRTSTDNSKRSNGGQSGLNFKKTETSEKVSEDFITASLLENAPKNSPSTNTTVESSSGETSNSDTQNICPITSDNPIDAGFTKSNRSESAIKTSKNTLKYSKISLLAEALAAIEDILNSDETNTSEPIENICEIPEEHINTTCYTISNETTSTDPIDYVEVIEDTGNNLQSSTSSSDGASNVFEESLEAKIDAIPVCLLQNNISSLMEETNVENLTDITCMVNETTTGTTTEVVFTDKLNQILSNQAAPGPTSIIIIPINNNAVGQPQSHMIDTTGNAPIIVYIPSTQSNDVSSQTMFCDQNTSQASLDKTVPNNELSNDLSNMAPLLNDNPAPTALVSELLNDISNSESPLPMCEPLPINSMCYNNESSQSSIKEKPFLNNSTHKSLTDMIPFVNSTCDENSLENEHIDICDDVNTEKTLPQMLDSEHPIFDFPGSEVTSLSHGPYNNVMDNELPILTREVPSEHQFVPEDKNVILDYCHKNVEPVHQVNPADFVSEPGFLSHEALSEGFMPQASSGVSDVLTDNIPESYESDLPISVEIIKPGTLEEPIHVSLLPMDESIHSLPISENLGALAKTADKTIPTPATKAHTTSIPIELSLSSDSPTTNSFDRRIIIDVKLVPIEGSSGDHHSTTTDQDTLPLFPDISSPQPKTDKLLSERQDHINSMIYNEPSTDFSLVSRDNFQEQRYETLPSIPYSETIYNLPSFFEVDESKPYLMNNLVAPIPNTVSSHDNIDATTKDIKDLPLRMGILLPDFSELTEDEPISYNVPKIEHSEESVHADIFNGLAIDMLDHLPLSHPTHEFDKTSFPTKLMKADDMSNDTPKELIWPVVPEDELKLEAIKPIESNIKIDELTKETVTPVAEFVAASDENEYMRGKLNDKKLQPPPKSENSLSEVIALPTDISSFTSKLLVTKALLDNILADISNTYNTGVLSPSTKSIPISFPLNDTNTAVEFLAPEPLLLECPSIQNQSSECNVNSSLSSEEVFSNTANHSKKGSSNMLLDIKPGINIDEDNDTDINAKSLENFTLSEDMRPNIPILDYRSSINQINNETVQTETAHDLTKSVDKIDNAVFSKISNNPSSETAVPDRLLLMNEPSNHEGVKIAIPHVDGNLSNEQELEQTNDSFSEEFKDTLPILGTLIDQTIIKEDAAKPNLPSQFNDSIFKTIDDISTITVTKDLLESVLLDIFTNRLSLPLTQAHFEAAPSVSEGRPHSPESTETTIGDTIQTSTLLGHLEDTTLPISVANKSNFKNKSAAIADTAYISKTVETQPPEVNKVTMPSVLENPTLYPPNNEIENGNKITIFDSDAPKHDNIDSSNQNATSSLPSEITITKELLESVLADVLRKEFLLPRAQSPPDISPLMFNDTSNSKETLISNTTCENHPKENDKATFNASLVDGPANLTDSVPRFNPSTDQSNTQTVDKIHIDLPLVDYVDKQFMATKEIVPTFNDESIEESTTTNKPPLLNVLKDISDESFTSSVDELAAKPSIVESHTPNDISSGTPLEHEDENFLNIQTPDCLDSPIDQENIEMLHIHEHEPTESPINDNTLPIDEIIISIPNEDILSPKSASELRITKALLENVLMDIFTKGLSVPAEAILQKSSDDDITKESPTQLLEISSSTSHTDHTKDDLSFFKETENSFSVGEDDKTSSITNSDIPTDHSNILSFNKEEANNDDPPLENGNAEFSSVEDIKLDPNKDVHEDHIPSTEKKKYSPSKLTITKALLENVLKDIFAKGLSLPKDEPSSVTFPKVLDKTLYYTETPIPDISNETPLVQVTEVPLDISLVEHTNIDSTVNEEETLPIPADSTITGNSEKTLPISVSETVIDIPSIHKPTEQDIEVTDNYDNQKNNLPLEEDNDDLSPLNEGISEPKTVPIASRSTLDKTFYTVDITLPNIREGTTPEPVEETFKITDNSNLSGEDNDSILELASNEITHNNHDLYALSKESYEEELLENNSEDLSNDAKEVSSLENTSDDLSVKEDMFDVIEDITSPLVQRPNRVLYSKLPSTKALLEKVLFDITNRGILV